MQFTERYEIRTTIDGETTITTLPDFASEHEAWAEFDAETRRPQPGQLSKLVRVSEVVLGTAATNPSATTTEETRP